jgi:AcrR family transcriptional regulator
MRQRISDVATIMFATRGFDNVKVSQVADVVGVSEKTIFNYFPTKESMVLDWADEAVESVARMLRERPEGESLTETVLRAMKRDMELFDTVPDELAEFLPRFGELIESTPALRAAWGDMYSRIVTVAREELAARAEVDPRDPEPMIAARALTGLSEVAFESRVRWIEAGLRGDELRAAVHSDLERAARLLETGLWSFNLLTHGRRTRQQVLDAAKAADDARAQVVKALRQARTAWREIRDQSREAMREQQAAKREAMRHSRSRSRR